MTYFLKHKSIILSILGTIFLSSAALFLENTIIAGIFSVLGLLLILSGGRIASTKLDIILNSVLIWIGHSIRFIGIFGSEFVYTLLIFVLIIPYSLIFVLALFLDRYLLKTNHVILASFVIPITYSLCAFLLAILNFGFIFNITSYIMCIPIISLNLSYLGEYLLTFILMWILISFVSIFMKSKKKVKLVFSFVSIILTSFLLISGTILYNKYDTPDYTIKVALATSQESDFTGESGIDYTKEEQLDMFLKAIKKASDEDAKLLVLNEEYFYFEEENSEYMLSSISNIVKNYGIATLIGVYVICEDKLSINEAIYFDNNGNILYTYIKNNLVPFIEKGYCEDGIEKIAFVHTTIDGHEIDISFVICYDINDEMYLRKIDSSTDLLIVPSWDWDTCNIEQYRTHIRSSTLKITLLKHTYDGFSYVSLPNGKCKELVDFRKYYETVKTVSIPIYER